MRADFERQTRSLRRGPPLRRPAAAEKAVEPAVKVDDLSSLLPPP